MSSYNRSALLPALVGAIRSQTVADFEVVLVDNGSTDDTHTELLRLTADDPRLRVARVQQNRGPAPARNMAWRRTSAPWVAFTDDDCAPDPAWLEALLAAAASADLVQGRTVPGKLPPGTRPRWFDRSQRIEHWSARYETCNLFISREVLERNDGFSERFHIAMGEDTDLGLRAVAAGATTAFADDAVVVHHVFPSGFGDYLHQRRRYAEIVELFAANPAARELLHGRFVLRGVHLLVWGLIPLTGAATVLGIPWASAAVVLGWSLWNTRRTRRRPFPAWKRFGFSIAHFGAFAYETWCFARASVRYRALVI